MHEDAGALEKSLLTKRKHAFPCGCVAIVAARYPGEDWLRTNEVPVQCGEHPFPAPYMYSGSPMEGAWLTHNGEKITKEELQKAFDAWLWRNKNVSFRYNSDGTVTVVKPRDPMIIAVGNTHCIGRDGSLHPMPLVSKRPDPGDLLEPGFDTLYESIIGVIDKHMYSQPYDWTNLFDTEFRIMHDTLKRMPLNKGISLKSLSLLSARTPRPAPEVSAADVAYETLSSSIKMISTRIAPAKTIRISAEFNLPWSKSAESQGNTESKKEGEEVATSGSSEDNLEKME